MTETNKFKGAENKRLFGVSCCWLYKNRRISLSFCVHSRPISRHPTIWHPFHFYFRSPLPNEMKRNRKKNDNNNNKSNNNSEAFYRPFRGWTDASSLFVHVFKYFTYPRSEETTVYIYIYIYILVAGIYLNLRFV